MMNFALSGFRPKRERMPAIRQSSPSSIVQLCRLVLIPRRDHFKRDFHFGETNMATTYLPRVTAADHEALRRLVDNYQPTRTKNGFFSKRRKSRIGKGADGRSS
jgi:hypothetical protein